MRLNTNRFQIKLRIDDIALFLILMSLNRIFWNEAATTTMIRMYVVIVISTYIIIREGIRYMLEYKHAFGYLQAMLLSGIVNYGISSDLLSTLLNVLLIANIFAVVDRYTRVYGLHILINSLYKIVLLFVLVNDISVFIADINWNTITSLEAATVYFSGNKFAVAFLHMIFMMLFGSRQCCQNSQTLIQKTKLILLAVYSIILCLYMHCGTGAIGCFVLAVLIYYRNSLERIVCKPINFVVSLIGLNYLFIGTPWLLSNNVIQSLILMLGKDISLTGRMRIYPQLAGIIQKSLFVGYGDSSQIVMRVVGYGNAQNGILHIMIQFGLIGAVAFVYMVVRGIYKVKDTESAIKYSAIAYIFALVVCSLVEICFSYNFIFAVALLNAIAVQKKYRES